MEIAIPVIISENATLKKVNGSDNNMPNIIPIVKDEYFFIVMIF
jgi:hypothetical protein